MDKYRFTLTIQTLEAFTEFFQAVFAKSHPEMDVEIVRSQRITGIALISGEQILSPMVRLDTLYDKYVGGADLSKIYCEISSACEEYDARGGSLLNILEDYGLIRHRICYCLMNYGKNKELLQTMPHRRWLDLAVALYIPVSVSDGKALYIAVDNDLVEKWGITDMDLLFKEAGTNTPDILPGSIRDIEDVFRQDYGSAPEPGYEEDDRRMYIATNKDKFYGAAVVLYEGLLASFAQELGSDLYLLPTSINKMAIVADTEGVDAIELKKGLRSSNRGTTEDKDFLSDNVYRYDRAAGNITII